MIIHPFRALRAAPEHVQQVASVPYDVVDTAEAAELARDNPLSFLHVVRSEIDLPADTDPYAEAVYQKAAENLLRLREAGQLLTEDRACLYGYRITTGDHSQVGVLTCCSLSEYDSSIIKKHELTRRDKEDDRTRHILTTGAQSGPVLLTYRDVPQIEELLKRVISEPALLSCRSESDALHEIWRIADTAPVVEAFAAVREAYVADGHHRTASALRACQERRRANAAHTGNEEYNYFLAVLFPASQMRILAYNRVVSDLNGQTPEEVLNRAAERFEVSEAVSTTPSRPRELCVYLAGGWHTLRIKPQFVDDDDPVRSLDCSLVQEHFIEPILGVRDLREDPRISFVGGIRGTEHLEKLVDRAGDGIALSLYPTAIDQLLAVADAGKIMPPKSTWFEPKLRSGMVVHLI